MLSEKLLAHFDAAVKQAGLAEHRNSLLADARECVHVHYGKPKGRLPLGASRIGGTPDLPTSLEWPAGLREGKPFGKAAFLAQFNLAELPPVADVRLPRQGHLWIFLRDTALYDAPAVIYRDVSEPRSARDKPSVGGAPAPPADRDLQMAPLRFSAGVSLPFSSKTFQRKRSLLSVSSEAADKLHGALVRNVDTPNERIDGRIGGYSFQAEIDLSRQIAIEQLGGAHRVHADTWESVAQLEAQIERGLPLFAGDAAKQKSYRDRLRKEIPHVTWIEENESRIAATASCIRLLCMFRPNAEIGLDLGDGMFLDFLINEAALADRDFGHVYCRSPMLL